MNLDPRATLALLLLAPLGAAAQRPPKPEEVVALRATPERLKLRPGATVPLKLKVEILPGFHINADKPTEDYLIPTEVFLPEGAEFELAGARFPKAELKSFVFAPDTKLAVYEGTIEVALRVRARPAARPGIYTLPIGLRFQACSTEVCLRPAERRLTLDVEVRSARTERPRPAS